VIRRAEPADAAALSRLGRRTFSETFGHLYPPADLAAFLAEAHSQAFYAAALADPGQAAWIAEADGEAAGYALAGACALPHPDVTPGCGELKRLYVLQGRRNGGLGGALAAAALDWLAAPGRRLWVGVWSQNLGAQRLYARLGFEKAGEYLFPVGQARDQEFILRR
jgi:ribosomal protein S18 acetylase RimI-like enzyme